MNLPTTEMSGYYLVSGEDLKERYSDSFFIPDLEDRKNVQPGINVQLIFSMTVIGGKEENSIERMWVQVRDKVQDFYVGLLNNDPAANVYIKCGDKLVFKAEHIIKIYKDG